MQRRSLCRVTQLEHHTTNCSCQVSKTYCLSWRQEDQAHGDYLCPLRARCHARAGVYTLSPLPPSSPSTTRLLRHRLTMPAPTFAPAINTRGANHVPMRDPFATPPAIPPATAQIPSAYHANALGRAVLYHEQSHDEQVAYSQSSSSWSSFSKSSSMIPISSIDLEKNSGVDASEVRSVGNQPRRASRDPEKAAQSPAGASRSSRVRQHQEHVTRTAYLDEDMDDIRHVQEEKAWKILLFLSGPCVVLSVANMIWTLISLIVTIMTQPVRLCARRPTFGQQLGGLVGPALNLHLESIYTFLPPHADEDTSYQPGMLVVVMLLSPLLSLGMMLAAWVTAIFWAGSGVVGDPSGTDKRDDGRETVLTLRNWWEVWLVRSIRED